MALANELTLGDIVSDNALRFPDTVAYRDGRRTITHSQLRQRAVQLISAMAAAGVGRQDRVAVLSRNSVEFGELNAATQLSGIIMATISFRLSRGEMDDAIRRVDPSIVFCADEYMPTIADLVAQMPSKPIVVSIGEQSRPGTISFERFIDGDRRLEPEFLARADDVAYLLFTSGTTGASKCCILGQREMRKVVFTMSNEMRCGSADRALINMPMFHVGALAIIGGVHARGGTVVLQEQFDVTDAMRLIADEQITLLHLAPVMLNSLLDRLGEGASVQSLRTILYAAAPMTATTLQRAITTIPRARFLNFYGQTEAIVSGLPSELHDLASAGATDVLRSVGFPFPDTHVRVVGEDGATLSAGQTGEILVRSDCMFRGYWQDAAATRATLRDGWCHTGDMGRLDERGLLYLVDRKKDVIISGGENIYSPEVEDAVAAIDGVAACAVVGVPDDRWGEAVCAVVVPTDGSSLTLEFVQEHVRGSLARYKVPRRLVLLAELPILASGKVDKKKLRADLSEEIKQSFDDR
jgi:acyl-CoA synthetase (AMP-forming)/AMP-acid ligase II